jgi:hypothetical protein
MTRHLVWADHGTTLSTWQRLVDRCTSLSRASSSTTRRATAVFAVFRWHILDKGLT